MTIRDSPTLSSLMASYDRSVTFLIAAPTSFEIAKMFCEMHWANGGLVLFGVDADGSVIGIKRDEVEGVYHTFDRLCPRITDTRVEIGTLNIETRLVVFLVFNPVLLNMDPLEDYRGSIELERVLGNSV